jgi:hypothetical protein
MSIQMHSSQRGRRVSAAILAGAALSAGVSVAPAWAPTCGASCANYPVNPPTSIEQCKADGWQTYSDAHGDQAFTNQGDCVSFVQTAQHAHDNQGNGGQAVQFPTNPG